MRKASLVTYSNKESDFFKKKNKGDIEDWNICWRHLRNEMASAQWDLNTIDKNPIASSEVVFFIDVPPKKYLKQSSQKWFLFLIEPKCIYGPNYDRDNHTYFDVVFTFDNSLVDNIKYFLLSLAHDLTFKASDKKHYRSKFVNIVAGFKKSYYKYELYSKRYEIIKWYSLNKPELLDHYGYGWPKSLRNVFIKNGLESRLPGLAISLFDKILKKNNVYRGPVKFKRETLKNYKFTYVIENSYDQLGYISEKIFDALCSFSIPIYLGAPNINYLIPDNCFIDMRDFTSVEELNNYIISLNEEELNNYRNCIHEFFQSVQSHKFTSKYFSQRVLSHISKVN